MRIAVIGAGGIGAIYGAALAQAGAEVIFVAPGVVRQTGTYCQMTFGELDGRISSRGERLRDLCAAAGIDGVLSPDVRVPIWQKFLLLVPLANVNSLTRLPLGRYRADPDTW